MREVPVDVELSMEWARASTLLRIVYAEVRPRARERVGVLEQGESVGGLVARMARAVKVPVRPGEAEALGDEGARVGLWRVVERLVEGVVWRFLVVPALPPSVERARREADEADRGVRGGKSDKQRQREHRARERGPEVVAVLPGAEVPPGYVSPSVEAPSPGQVSDENVTDRSRQNSVTAPSVSRDTEPRGSGGPPSLSGTPEGVPREGGGGPAPDAPAPTAAPPVGGVAAGGGVLSPPPGPVVPAADAASWAAALEGARSVDKAARRAALEALGRGLVATWAARLGPAVFDGRAATVEELRGLGAVLVREGVDRAKLLEVRGWLGAEAHERPAVRSEAREAFRWDAAVREKRAPVTVALLLGKRVGDEHRGSGWRAAAKASGAWADRLRAAKVALTFSDDGPGPGLVRAGEVVTQAVVSGG